MLEAFFAHIGQLLVAGFGSFFFAAIGVAILVAAWFVLDLILKKINFEEELQKGNTAVGVMLGGFLIAVGVIVAAAIN